jgi:hypothetical protein
MAQHKEAYGDALENDVNVNSFGIYQPPIQKQLGMNFV